MLASRDESRKESAPAYRATKEIGGNFGGNFKWAISIYHCQSKKYNHHSVASIENKWVMIKNHGPFFYRGIVAGYRSFSTRHSPSPPHRSWYFCWHVVFGKSRYEHFASLCPARFFWLLVSPPLVGTARDQQAKGRDQHETHRYFFARHESYRQGAEVF